MSKVAPPHIRLLQEQIPNRHYVIYFVITEEYFGWVMDVHFKKKISKNVLIFIFILLGKIRHLESYF